MSSRVDCKVVLLGQAYGGKTSLMERFLRNVFNDEVPYCGTVGAAFGAKLLVANGKSFTLGIWDTAGSERYEALTRLYYRGAKAAVVCYDLTDRSHFEKARFWINELHETEENCKVYLTGTKLDLVKLSPEQRAMDHHDVQDFCDEMEAFLIETSSKTGENVQALFEAIANDFTSIPQHAAKLRSASETADERKVVLVQNGRKYRKTCCKS